MKRNRILRVAVLLLGVTIHIADASSGLIDISACPPSLDRRAIRNALKFECRINDATNTYSEGFLSNTFRYKITAGSGDACELCWKSGEEPFFDRAYIVWPPSVTCKNGQNFPDMHIVPWRTALDDINDDMKTALRAGDITSARRLWRGLEILLKDHIPSGPISGILPGKDVADKLIDWADTSFTGISRELIEESDKLRRGWVRRALALIRVASEENRASPAAFSARVLLCPDRLCNIGERLYLKTGRWKSIPFERKLSEMSDEDFENPGNGGSKEELRDDIGVLIDVIAHDPETEKIYRKFVEDQEFKRLVNVQSGLKDRVADYEKALTHMGDIMTRHLENTAADKNDFSALDEVCPLQYSLFSDLLRACKVAHFVESRPRRSLETDNKWKGDLILKPGAQILERPGESTLVKYTSAAGSDQVGGNGFYVVLQANRPSWVCVSHGGEEGWVKSTDLSP